jgi:hypothetical protein
MCQTASPPGRSGHGSGGSAIDWREDELHTVEMDGAPWRVCGESRGQEGGGTTFRPRRLRRPLPVGEGREAGDGVSEEELPMGEEAWGGVGVRSSSGDRMEREGEREG